ncbi:MAG: cation:proton antiporter [Bacteroidales bacterium]|nr:cation:proton antiporter [Bacteroidales bacterium]
MKRLIILSLSIGLLFAGAQQLSAIDISGKSSPATEISENLNSTGISSGPEEDNVQQHTTTDEDEHSGSHGSDMSPLFFIILALLIGAAVRHLLRKSPLPFTVWLLIIGLALGAMLRLGWFGIATIGNVTLDLSLLQNAFSWAGNIDPHIIMYVFLPTLIFEAAFAMDVHTFRKSAVNATLLAIPGIIIAMFLTAFIMLGIKSIGLGLEGWGWAYALMFGAVASATDPVAVVALLKELGASKKLGTLIEGESMLNDGTAIVLFMLFLLMVTGGSTDTSPIVEFLKVAVGGILVGVIIGGLTIRWVRKVFNDALVEISVIVAAAYITFFICEHFLHVSGVLGLVALGLAMASVGKTRISPEVEHFLHEFWELFAFIANTLIFIIVGVVIAEQSSFTVKNALILLILYVGVHIIRAIVIAIFYPIMKKVGYGLPKKDAIVVWYGALRGAVGLALALIVAGESAIPEEIRGQFLFFTAGLVTLTLLINATTIKPIVKRLGLTKVSPAKKLIQINAQKYLYNSSRNAMEKTKLDRYLSRANWNVVEDYLPQKVSESEGSDIKIDTIAEYRRRILEKEKSSYWHQFKDGLLGPTAVMSLSETIQKILDEGGMIPLSQRKDLEENWKTGKWIDIMQRVPFLSKISRRIFFENISVSYDSARGFVQAQEDALKLIERMVRGLEAESVENKEKDAEILEKLEEEITENRMLGQTFLRNLRKNYPEIYTAVATRQAIRTLLNYERYTVERMQKNGQLETGEADKITEEIEERMKRLMYSPPVIHQPEIDNLLKDSALFKDLDAQIMEEIVPKFQTRIYSVGDRFIKENAPSEGLYFVARGTVRVSVNDHDIDILSTGAFIGEIASLTGSRTANVYAESPVTVFWIPSKDLSKMVEKYPQLAERIWEIGGVRIAENTLGKVKPYNQWKPDQLKSLVQKGKVISHAELDEEDIKDKAIVLLNGKAIEKQTKNVIKAPALLEHIHHEFSDDARLFVC